MNIFILLNQKIVLQKKKKGLGHKKKKKHIEFAFFQFVAELYKNEALVLSDQQWIYCSDKTGGSFLSAGFVSSLNPTSLLGNIGMTDFWAHIWGKKRNGGFSFIRKLVAFIRNGLINNVICNRVIA